MSGYTKILPRSEAATAKVQSAKDEFLAAILMVTLCQLSPVYGCTMYSLFPPWKAAWSAQASQAQRSAAQLSSAELKPIWLTSAQVSSVWLSEAQL